MTTTTDALAIAVEHHQAGRLQVAEQIYREILAIDADQVDALHLLGVVASQTDRQELAVACITRAIELNENETGFHNNLGNAYKAQGKLDEAVASYRRALELKPDFAEAHNNLGNALQAQWKLDEAVVSHRRAVELKPDYAVAHNDLGNAFKAQGKLNEAVDCFRRALELNSDLHTAHSNLGNAFSDLGKMNEAAACFRRALQLEPGFAEARFNQALSMLRGGDFERGWAEYEWRWKCELKEREFSQPRWDGRQLEHQTILLHAEQGFGDTLQFVRYAAVIKQQNPAATVVLECQRPLVKLLAKVKGVDRLVAEGDELPPFDVHIPLLSVPGILGTTQETIPVNVPYLLADKELIAKWRERLSEVREADIVDALRVPNELPFRGPGRPGPDRPTLEDQVWSRLIGINWQGRRGKGEYRKRDIPLRYLAELARIPGVRLISLQKGAERAELTEASISELGEDWDTTAGAFMDTAAIMKTLDLVITSDTSVPHLAGALGVPVWVALPFVAEWRWLLDRSDSPWYPTMLLFRQKEPGDWAGVFEEIRGALMAMLGRS